MWIMAKNIENTKKQLETTYSATPYSREGLGINYV